MGDLAPFSIPPADLDWLSPPHPPLLLVVTVRLEAFPFAIALPHALVCVALFFCVPLRSFAEETDVWSKEGWPLVEQYCLDCHNADANEGDINLEPLEDLTRLDAGEIDGGTISLAKRALDLIRFGAMPPVDADLPSEEERDRLVQVMRTSSFAAICDLNPRPGKVTVRRLNRAEYNNSVRDILEIDIAPADAFPSDEVGAGFDNNGDVLSLPPMLFEKYIAAAEEIGREAILDPRTLKKLETEIASDQMVVEGDTKTGSFYGRFLAADAYAWFEVEVPYAGEYSCDFRAGRSVKAFEELSEKEKADGKKPNELRQRFAVYDADGKLLTGLAFKYFGGFGGSDDERVTLQLNQGINRLIVVPVESDFVGTGTAPEGLPDSFDRIGELTEDRIEKGRKGRDKPLEVSAKRNDLPNYLAMLRQVRISGPSRFPNDLYPKSHYRLLKHRPRRRGRSYQNVAEAAAKSLQPLMERAFRGPVSEEDALRYGRLAEQATKRGESFERGMQIAVAAVFVSPRFLFRVESPEWLVDDTKSRPDDWKEQRTIPLSDYQLATRLSYFLWSSTPDRSLMDMASKGKLQDEKTLRSVVQRMLQDPKGERLGENFAEQWLGLRNLAAAEPDTQKFPQFTAELGDDMVVETRTFFNQAVRDNLPIANLLDADYSYVNARLAGFYGIQGIKGDHFRRVSLKGTGRGGLLSQAGILTLTSYPTRTSPVLRGKWILENILGTPAPEAPGGVPPLEDADPELLKKPLREQLAVHRADPACAGCHRVMDELGFGFEAYNAIGRVRDQEIDSSGELPGGKKFAGPMELTQILRRQYSRQFVGTVTHRLMTFALGRELTPKDDCVIEEIIEKTHRDEASEAHRFVQVIQEIVLSKPFRFAELPEEIELAQNDQGSK